MEFLPASDIFFFFGGEGCGATEDNLQATHVSSNYYVNSEPWLFSQSAVLCRTVAQEKFLKAAKVIVNTECMPKIVSRFTTNLHGIY